MAESKKDLEVRLRKEIEEDLREKIRVEVQTQEKDKMRLELEAEIRTELEGKVAGDIIAEIKAKRDAETQEAIIKVLNRVAPMLDRFPQTARIDLHSAKKQQKIRELVENEGIALALDEKNNFTVLGLICTIGQAAYNERLVAVAGENRMFAGFRFRKQTEVRNEYDLRKHITSSLPRTSVP